MVRHLCVRVVGSNATKLWRRQILTNSPFSEGFHV